MNAIKTPLTFDAYVGARLPALVRFATVLTGNPVEAEDLVQNALIKTLRHWRKVSRADQPDAYVRRIIVNTHISSGRRLRVLEQLRDVLPERRDLQVHTDLSTEVAATDCLERALGRLPARQRAVLILRHSGYSDTEVAEVLGCAAVTVRAYASKGRAALRDALHKEDQMLEHNGPRSKR